jgi:hypothetical protein
MTAKDWLNSSRNYIEGLKILREHSTDAVLLSVLSSGETFYNKTRLAKELQALKPARIVPLPEAKTPKKFKADGTPTTYGRLKMSDYPEALHAAFIRQNELYKMVGYNHNRLGLLHELDQGKCAAACKAIIEGWREINSIYRLLDYWAENKVILPNKWTPAEKIEPKDRADAMRMRNNLRCKISRYKNNPEKVAAVEGWKHEIEELELLLSDG